MTDKLDLSATSLGRQDYYVVVEHEEDADYLRDIGVDAIALSEQNRLALELPRGPGSDVLLVGAAAQRCADQLRGQGVARTWGAHLPPGHVCVSHYLEERAKVVDYVIGNAELVELWRVIEDTAFLIHPRGRNGVSVDGVNTPPPFPIGSLPTACRNFVLAGAAAQGVDPTFYATPMLAVLAGAIGNSRRVALKGSYSDSSVLWTAVVSPSGSGKTPALRAVLQPLRDRDRELHEQTERDQQRYEAELMQWEIAKKAAVANKAPEAPPKPTPPPMRAILVEDITAEALAERLLDNPRGLVLGVDELAGWFQSFNSYKARGNDEQKWLQIYNADVMKVDRKATAGTRRRTLVPRAAVSIAGTIQPEVAGRILNRSMRECGMASRILLAAPEVRPVVWTEDSISDEVTRAYTRVVRTLLDLTANDPPLVLRLTPEAREVWIKFYNLNGSQCAAALRVGNQDQNAVLSKIRGAAPRIALALALARSAEDGVAELLREISVDAMRAGIEIAEWFAAQAQILYRQWDIDDAGEPRDLVDLVASLMPRFGGSISPRELQRSTRRFRSAQDARQALQALADAGHGEWKSVTAKNGQTVRKFNLFADPADAVDADAILEVGRLHVDGVDTVDAADADAISNLNGVSVDASTASTPPADAGGRE